MAIKSVYFYNVEIKNEETESIYLKHKRIIDENGKFHEKENGKYISVKLYSEEDEKEENKIIFDVLEFNKKYLFGRLGRQSKPGVLGERDYESGSLEDVLTADEEAKRGIQLVNYFYFVYSSNILCMTNTRGGANYISFNNIVNYFDDVGIITSKPIPNRYGLNAFYNNDYSKIKSIEFESAKINMNFLKAALGVDEKTLLEISSKENKVGIYIKADNNKYIVNNKDIVKNIIDTLKEGLKTKKINKAKFKGNIKNEKIQEYDLKSLYYRYKIDVKLHRYKNGKKIALSLDELKDEYLSALETAYKEKEETFLKMI